MDVRTSILTYNVTDYSMFLLGAFYSFYSATSSLYSKLNCASSTCATDTAFSEIEIEIK